MRYAVLANLSFSTPALRDNLNQAIKTRILGKPTWGAVGLGVDTDMEGRPTQGLEVRFNNRADMDDLFAFIKDRMGALPVLKGWVSIHECSHDEGNVRSCVIEQQYSK